MGGRRAVSYIRLHGLGQLTAEQHDALTDITAEEIRELPVEQRVDLALRQREIELQKRSSFWDALASFATAAIPLATFLGIESFFRLRGKK